MTLFPSYQKVVFDTDSNYLLHDPYENLAVAVLVTALKDYSIALTQDQYHPTAKNNIKIRKLRQFFASEELEIYSQSNASEIRKLIKLIEVEYGKGTQEV